MDLDAPDYLIKLSELGDDQFGLDSSRHTNVGRFVNHSCDPNLVLVRALIEETGLIIDLLYIYIRHSIGSIRLNQMKHSDFRCPQVALFALKDIEPNEELCYDYGDIFWSFKGTKSLCHCQRFISRSAPTLNLITHQ